MIDSMHVLDVLQKRGYEPQDDPDRGEGWFDLAIRQSIIRAVLTDEGGSEIVMFTGPYITDWSAIFSIGTHGAVFLAALDAAEQLAREG